MSNLFTSTIGKKLIMSISGLFLILFLLFHMSMNIAAIFSTDAYNAICEFLGANWYALLGTLVLAAGVVVHLIYATWLTLHNRRSRGEQRYAVEAMPKEVTWASRNMFVLGTIIVTVQGHGKLSVRLVDVEPGVMVNSGKQPPTHERAHSTSLKALAISTKGSTPCRKTQRFQTPPAPRAGTN